MSDESIAARIERLVSEEHELRDRERGDSPDPRQRRALGDAGSDPEQAAVRDADTVEHYQQ